MIRVPISSKSELMVQFAEQWLWIEKGVQS